MVKLEHGIHSKTGELLHISSVSSGLACDCLCPACKLPLVARKRGARRKHFAHYNSGECRHARETAIHLIAKDIIAKDGVFFPKWQPPKEHIIWRYYDSPEGISNIPEKYRLYDRHIVFNDVRIEHRTGDIIPDITGFLGSEPFLIEVAVTHFIDDDKYEKIVTQGISCLEINLDIPRKAERDEIERRLQSNAMWSKWIYCREGEEYLKQFEEEKRNELHILARTQHLQDRLSRFDHRWKLSKKGNFSQRYENVQFLVYWKNGLWKCKYSDIWSERKFDKLHDAIEALRSHHFCQGEYEAYYEPMDEQGTFKLEQDLYLKGFKDHLTISD